MGSAASRLRTALELFEVGEQMMRARLARENPEWDESQIDVAIHRWLRDRPGARAARLAEYCHTARHAVGCTAGSHTGSARVFTRLGSGAVERIV
ncbi:hypothetical protein, partial [Propioniciclava sp. MC1595]|uniref:hypothetical protein n=1 Tax=Propioniciclava sp. MC1595 TaxID=2760308 RepID=UPI0035CCFA9F